MRDVFDVVAEPTRRSILDQLRSAEGCVVGELAVRLGLSQPTVSKHLKVLREAGLVSAYVQAQQRRYVLQPDGLRDLEAWLAPYRRFWNERLDDLGAHLDSTHPRKGPST